MLYNIISFLFHYSHILPKIYIINKQSAWRLQLVVVVFILIIKYFI